MAGKSLVEIRLECLAKDWLVAARPTSEEDKLGDDGKMTYHSFRTKFKAVSSSESINQIDVLNEVGHWVRGIPKTTYQRKTLKEGQDICGLS